MSNYPYCYNIKEGTKFFVAYFDKEKKQNTLLKCVAIGKHCHVRFGNYDYGYGAFTDVKVETPLGIRFITLTYNVSKGERGQCLMHLGPSLGVYVPSDEEVMVELYANVDGYKNGSQMMLVPICVDDFSIDTRGYEPYRGKLYLFGDNVFQYYVVDANDKKVRKSTSTCKCYRLDPIGKKLIPAVANVENGSYGLWTLLSKHTQRFATEHEAIVASHKDVVVIGEDFTPIKTEKSAKDLLIEWVGNQAISFAELKQIVDAM